MSRFLFLLFLILPLVSFAKPLKILTIQHPLHLLVYEISGHLNEVDTILSDNFSHHNFNLRPTDIIKLKDCDLLFNLGIEVNITNTLQKVLDNYPKLHLVDFKVFTNMPTMLPQRFRTDLLKDLRWDTHIWLNPDNIKYIAKVVKEALIAKDPWHTEDYQENYSKFTNNIDKAIKEITKLNKLVKYKPYIVTHDAYNYFEYYFNLPEPLATLTDAYHNNMGGKSVQNLLDLTHNNKEIRIIVDPQAKAKFLNNTNLKVCIIDPMLSNQRPAFGAYKEGLIILAQQFKNCLS